MSETIHIQLLNEGTITFRPVYAISLGGKSYKILDDNHYDSEDECWEFIPGTTVEVEKRVLNNQSVLIATKQVSK